VGVLRHARAPARAAHPLELRVALGFAALFLGLQVVTQLTIAYLGDAGLLALATLVGLSVLSALTIGAAFLWP